MSEALRLPAEVDAAFLRWIESTCARVVPPLTFSEVRRGVQALSRLYVERRREGRLASRALDGTAKRAALATFQAPLHFLAAWAALEEAARGERRCKETAGGESRWDGPAGGGDARVLVRPGISAPRASAPRVHDLGAGSGAVGAALALWLAQAAAPGAGAGGVPAVHAIDVSGWALGEARATGAALGLALRTTRGALPAAMPRTRAGDWLALGFFANELDDAARSALVERMERALDEGAGLLWLEPLALPAAPWWDEVAAALAAREVRALETRREIARPDWIARLDDASGLDHRTIGVRALVRAPVQARRARE